MDVARQGVRLAREAIAEAGRDGEVAVAFSLNGDLDAPDGAETIRLLGRAWETDPPDIILLETLSLVRDSTYDTVDAPAGDRHPGLAELPALPARGVRDLRRALGRAGGGRVRPRRAPLRAAGRRCAAHQLHAA